MEKKKPEIRFNGFEGEWVKDNAVYIFETYYDKNHPNLPVLSASQELGMVIRDNVGFQVQHNKENEVGYKRVLPGQFVIHLRSFQGGFAHSMVEGITSPAYTVMQFKNSSTQDDIYWKYVLTSKTFIKRLETVTYGIRDGRSISFEDFSELNFTFPSLSEQQKIGLFLTTLDKLIAKLEAKLDKLRKLKQALLEKMFANVNGGGYETPEIRFKGYTDKWEVKELREVAEFAKGKGYSKGDLTKEGIPIIRYGSLYTDYRTEIDSVSEYVQYSEGAIFSRGGEVIIPASGETSEDIARASAIKLPSVIIGGDLNIIYPNAEIDTVFLALEITYGKSHTYLAMKAQGASVVHLRKLDISTLSPKFPSLSEQEQIGKCFTQIDTHFNKTSTKLTKLRNIKQSLLQKMFA